MFRLINKTNLSKFNQAFLSSDWSQVFSTADPNLIYDLFSDKFHHLYNTSFPIKSNKPRKPWITMGLITTIKNKHTLFVKYIKQYSVENESKYKTYRNKLNHLIKRAKKSLFSKT